MKIKDHPNWERNQIGVLVNTNLSDYQTHLKKKQIFENKEEQIKTLQETINIMNGEIEDLKNLVKKIIEDKK